MRQNHPSPAYGVGGSGCSIMMINPGAGQRASPCPCRRPSVGPCRRPTPGSPRDYSRGTEAVLKNIVFYSVSGPSAARDFILAMFFNIGFYVVLGSRRGPGAEKIAS